MDILILSCGTGGGHNIAGQAVKEEMERRGNRVVMMDPYTLVNDKLGGNVGNVYITMVQRVPWLFGLIYQLGNIYRRLPCRSPVFWIHMRMVPYMKDYLEKNHFDVIFTTHPFPAEIFACMKAKGVAPANTVFIATDYTCIPFAEESGCDYCVIPTGRLTDEFVYRGISADSIRPLGIPVRSEFRQNCSRQEAIAELGLDPGLRYLLLTGGSIGAGKMWLALNELQQYLEEHPDTMLVTLCGSNSFLYQKMLRRYRENPQVCILEHTDQMAAYMKISDAVITKPGGLTSTEAAVSGVPILHIAPIPGCETKNAKFFSGLGMSMSVGKHIRNLSSALEQLLEPEVIADMTHQQKKEINHHSAEEICTFAESLAE